jgi:molybdopterin-containing oxidoreductase family membrane subunit
MAPEAHVMGLFADETAAAGAVEGIKGSRWRLLRTHSPIPSRRLAEAVGVKKSPVGWFTLAGGIIGFFTGFLLAAFTAARWGLIVSGKPVVALVPFFIVGFEFTILFAVFGNVVGLILQTGLPRYRDLETYDPRLSGDQYGVVAACDAAERPALEAFFTGQGATALRAFAGEDEAGRKAHGLSHA